MIDRIKIRGARVHNLKGVDVDIPLNKIVGVAGVSGSGKSSLALGVVYAEGSRRYLEALSTYTRRRMTQAAKAQVDEVTYVPAALALHQRPGVPGIRSTFGTATELLNSLRLMYSRLASHRCPNGHYAPPSLAVAAGRELVCPECGEHFYAPGAEELSFNSQGACPECGGTGSIRIVDESTLVPDESLTIDEGAVLPWQTLMWSLMKDIARDLGVRTDVPFRLLTPEEREIVFHGPAVKHHMIYQNRTSGAAGEMDFTYFNAIYTVENALAKVKDEKGMKRVARFLKEEVCPSCGGTRLSEAARAPRLRGISLDEACRMTLAELMEWVDGVPASLPEEMEPMARSICESFRSAAMRLMDLGLGYLTLDRASSTLSTGERQRMQLARAVRNRTTGVLYVLDEPSIGLHPSNIVGLNGVIRDLVADGNSVLLVDHDTQILKEADWLIEMGPGAGAAGGRVIAEGSVADVGNNPESRIGGFLSGRADTRIRRPAGAEEMFSEGRIRLSTSGIHTVKPLEVEIPKGRLTVVTGVSGSGKTTLVLESLVPALKALAGGTRLPAHVRAVEAEGIGHVKLIDATPIGVNVRSTVATYTNVHDELRKIYAKTPDAKSRGYKAEDFSYNTGRLRCPACDGTGSISLDVQFLPDVVLTCPECRGSRYGKDAWLIKHTDRQGRAYSLPELMDMGIDAALEACADMKVVSQRMQVLQRLGLGYLTLGEETPGLSGGEAQRLKLASEMGRMHVLDEPSIGLHPSNIVGLNGVIRDLVADGNSVLLVDHDTQILKEADWLIEMGPGAGAAGGRVIAEGSVADVGNNPESRIGGFLSGRADTRIRRPAGAEEMFSEGRIRLSTSGIHTVKPLEVEIPKGRLTVVTGVSGSGKTTLVLESLVPALKALAGGTRLPAHVRAVEAEGIGHVKLIDATPIGVNVRSTVATYTNVHDELRKIYAKTPDAKSRGYKAEDFSYNTGRLRCPACDGTGSISLDVQFLPDVVLTCPECRGSRYGKDAWLIKHTDRQGRAYSLPELMDMGIDAALEACADMKVVSQRMQVLQRLGLGYLTLGEETPGLSGGEAQRLKLASEMGRMQADSVFVFDEPTIGLHPLDVQVLLGVFQALIDRGATVVVIEHDLDVIRNADYIIDMGPGGGEEGGRIVAAGTLETVRQAPESRTGRYL